MNEVLSYWALVMALMIFPAVAGEAELTHSEDPVDYIRRSLQTYPIVCLGEGGHQAREPHQFIKGVLGHETILRTVDVIIVEFGAAKHQAVLDAYIRGEDVPFSKLSRVWRDTGQSPRAPWDSPLYHDLLEAIRKGNLTLPPKERVRVIAGDPPIDWEKILTREDYNQSRIPRDPYVASLAMEQAFDFGKRVLVIFGGAHLPKVPVGAEDDLRNSLTYHILQRHPGTVRVIEFVNPENLAIMDRATGLTKDRLYVTANHWLGLYSGHLVRDLFDALVYIGPSSDWGREKSSLDPERDREYLIELNRRSLLRFGRPLAPRQ
jgi:hypothetical protein